MQRVVRTSLIAVLAAAGLTACGGGGGVTEFNVPAKMTVSAGDGQTASRTQAVATAPAVTLTDTHGKPAAGVSVSFAASGGSTVTPSSVTTDAAGMARVSSWTLGSTAGNYSLTVTAAGYPTVTISATASPAKATSLSIVAGSGQTGTGLVAFATAPKVKVLDDIGAPMAGVAVVFSSSVATDSVVGASQTTGSDGTATLARWVPSAIGGPRTLTATATGLTSVSFTATSTAVPTTKTYALLCVPIGLTGAPAGLCVKDVTLKVTADATTGSQVEVSFRSAQGSIPNVVADSATWVAAYQFALIPKSGLKFGALSNIAFSTSGSVIPLGSGTASQVFTVHSRDSLIVIDGSDANGKAHGGSIGCYTAVSGLSSPFLFYESCDTKNQTGHPVFTFATANVFTAADVSLMPGFMYVGSTSSGWPISCVEPGSAAAAALPSQICNTNGK